MNKQLIPTCITLAAFAALIIPAAASANDPQLTEGGTLVPALAQVVATNVGEATFTNTSGASLVTCSTVKLSGHVWENSEGWLEMEMTTTDFGGSGSLQKGEPVFECTGSFGNATMTMPFLCIRADPFMSTDEMQIGAECPSLGSVRFLLNSTTAGECEYATTFNVSGTFTTGGTQTTLTVSNTQVGSGSTKFRGGFLCPSSGMLKMAFSLETANGTPLTIT